MRFSPGCKCCCPAKICASVSNCNGAVSGATITMTQGGTTLATGTTNSIGEFCWAYGSTTGDVTVSYTSGAWSGSQIVSIPTTGTCPDLSAPFTIVNKICVHAIGCGGNGDPLTVNVTIGAQTCTTDATTNACCITLTAPPAIPLTISAQCTFGGPTYTKSVTPTCNTTVDFGKIYGKVCVEVVDCSGHDIPGATVTLNATGQTCTTPSSGPCCIVPNAPIDSTATVTASYPGLPDNTSTVACAGTLLISLLPTGYPTTEACCPGDHLGVPINWCVSYAGTTFSLTLGTLKFVNVTINNANIQGPPPNFFCSHGSLSVCLGFLLTCGVDSYGNPTLSLKMLWEPACCVASQDPITGYTYITGVLPLDCSGYPDPVHEILGLYTVTNTLNPSAPSVSGTVPATIPWGNFGISQCGTTTVTPNGGGSLTATPGTTC